MTTPATASTTRTRPATPRPARTWPGSARWSSSSAPEMGEPITLTSPKDGFAFGAYRVRQDDARRGGLVLIQEIFGVTEHIRELADGFATDGYETLAPSLYDRQQRGFEAGYNADDVAKARRYSEAAPWDEVAADLAACVAALEPPVFVAGYCWGG